MPRRGRVQGQSPGHVGFRRGDQGRHLRLVVSVLAAGVLPGGAAAGGVPRLLRAAVRHRRAELDRLPPAERRPVPPLGGRGPGRLRVLGQAAARPARPGHELPRASARARRPARAGAHRLRGAARRRDALLRPGIGARGGADRVGLPRRVVGRGRRRRPRQRPGRRAVPLPAAARAALQRRRPAHRRSRACATPPMSTSGTRTCRPPPRPRTV